MPAPYRHDLREKALCALQSGHSITSVSPLFGISRSTLSRWDQRYQQHGEMATKAHDQRGHSHKICDWDEFRTFVQQHGDKTQAEMAQLWPGEISEDTIGRGLKHIGFTRKKRRMRTGNGERQNAMHS